MKKIVYLTKPAGHFVKETAEFCWDDMINVLYGYTFLFDPFILAAAGGIPEMRTLPEIRSWDKVDLCICGLPGDLVDGKMEDALLAGAKRLLRRGKGLVLVQPSRRVYRQLPELRNKRYVRDIRSMCEQWRIDVPVCRHSQNYPQHRMFQAVSGPGTVYSTVGEWPALLMDGPLALFTVDPLRAFARWNHGNVTWKHANLWVFITRRLLGAPEVDPEEIDRQVDLRRDFHAFGYALVMLRELAEVEKRPLDRFIKTACAKVLAAADAFVRQKYPAAQAVLGEAFKELYRGRCSITPMDIHLVDSLHGSTMYPDAGFAEFEWPEELNRYMRMFFHWMKTRNYRLCLDWDVRSFESLVDRYPILVADIRRWMRAGRLECINGGYAQQYPHYCSPQANIENIRQGRGIFERLFGQAPATYGGQECCMNPQMPNLLTNLGYRQALHRIQNFGQAPLVKEAVISWRGKDGRAIPAIPGNPTGSERLGSIFYLLLAYKIHQSLREGVREPVLTNLQDISLVAFREETCRTAYYAPVFGRHTTLSEYFGKRRGKLAVKSFDYYDYLYGYFYNNTPIRGNENDSFSKAAELERTVADAQLLNGLAVSQGRSRPRDFWPAWDTLFGLQAHDGLIAGNFFMGSFFHSGGPMDFGLTIAARARRDYASILERTSTGAARDLRAVLGAKGGRPAAFNTLGFSRTALFKTPDGYGRAELPAWGSAPAKPVRDGHVRVNDDVLENEYLNIRFDSTTGAIAEIRDKSTGKPAAVRANEFVYGTASAMRMTQRRILERDACRGEVLTGGVILDGREKIAFYETRVALADGSRTADIHTRLFPVTVIPPNPCDHAFRVSVRAAGGKPEIITNYLNVSETLREPAVEKQYRNFTPRPYPLYCRPSDPRVRMFNSPNYVRLCADGHTVDMFNDGPQWYYVRRKQILQHLIGNNDHCFDFHYALAVNNPQHPFKASLDWQTPVLPCRINNGIPSGLFATDLPNVILFGCAYLGAGTFRIRAMEISGQPVRGPVTGGYPIRQALETDYLGNRRRTLKAAPSHFDCELPAWGITEYRVTLTLNGGNV